MLAGVMPALNRLTERASLPLVVDLSSEVGVSPCISRLSTSACRWAFCISSAGPAKQFRGGGGGGMGQVADCLSKLPRCVVPHNWTPCLALVCCTAIHPVSRAAAEGFILTLGAWVEHMAVSL